jgi:hypothetical protein
LHRTPVNTSVIIRWQDREGRISPQMKDGDARETRSAAVGRNETSATNLALAPPVHGGDETDRPAPRDVGNQASKFFNTEKQGERTEVTEKDSMALRAVFDRALRGAPSFFSSVSWHVLPVSPC